jgi:hypothetical protein
VSTKATEAVLATAEAATEGDMIPGDWVYTKYTTTHIPGKLCVAWNCMPWDRVPQDHQACCTHGRGSPPPDKFFTL